MNDTQRRALFVMGLGLGVVFAAIWLAPRASTTLYDGVNPQEPYRYVVPPPGQAPTQGRTNIPSSQKVTVPLSKGVIPDFAAATTESPPQAQLIAKSGSFVLSGAAQSLTVTIDPLAPSGDPTWGHLVGNAYQLAATDEAGTPVRPTSGSVVTVILRSPQGVFDAAVARFNGQLWQELRTDAGGEPHIFLADTEQLGEFAVVELPASTWFGLDPRWVVALAGGSLSVALLGFLVLRRRRPVVAASGWAGRQRRREKRQPKRR